MEQFSGRYWIWLVVSTMNVEVILVLLICDVGTLTECFYLF